MRQLILPLLIVFLPALLFGQENTQVQVDTMIYGSRKCMTCPQLTDTIVYKLLKCGLYLGSNGDIAYRTEETYSNDDITFQRRTRYLNWIYGAAKDDSINGGLKEMKYVIDTASFQFLSDLYWADKNNIYGFNPMSDGGTVYLNEKTDRRTFVVLDNAGYAKDKRNVYYRGTIIEGADLKTFKSLKHKEIPELACDKLYFYQIGQRMTDKEVKEWKLENFKK